MTTKRILEIEEAGVGFPDCYFGQGAVFAGREARIKRAKGLVRLIGQECETMDATFEQAEAATRLRGRLV